MPYFSRKGDQGRSELINGRDISKGDPIFDLLGAIDELNAFIGLAICAISDEYINDELRSIQVIFSEIMANISGLMRESSCEFEISESLISLENKIDSIRKDLSLPDKFTFPGRTEAGARLDICRTYARRVERIAVALKGGPIPRIEDFYPFLNRISTYFYLLRLKFEYLKETPEKK